MSTTRLVYTARQNAESESGAQVLADVYHFILHCAIESYENEKAAGVSSTNGDDAERRSGEIGADHILQP